MLHKTCNHCKINKPMSEFHKNARRIDNTSKRCKTCASEMAKRFMDENRAEIRAYNRAWAANRRGEIRKLLWGYKSTHSCVDCGASNPVVLEFDHVHEPKICDLNGMARTMRSDTVILAEIAKCEMRCANCHRIRHHAEKPL